MLLLPTELQGGSPADTVRRLGDPVVRRALRTEWFPHNRRLGSMTLSYLRDPAWRWAEGWTWPPRRWSGSTLTEEPGTSPTSSATPWPRTGSRSGNATYADPRRVASGVSHVVVNGRLALADGAVTGVVSGRPVRLGRGPGGSAR